MRSSRTGGGSCLARAQTGAAPEAVLLGRDRSAKRCDAGDEAWGRDARGRGRQARRWRGTPDGETPRRETAGVNCPVCYRRAYGKHGRLHGKHWGVHRGTARQRVRQVHDQRGDLGGSGEETQATARAPNVTTMLDNPAVAAAARESARRFAGHLCVSAISLARRSLHKSGYGGTGVGTHVGGERLQLFQRCRQPHSAKANSQHSPHAGEASLAHHAQHDGHRLES